MSAYRKRYAPAYDAARAKVDACSNEVTASDEFAKLGEKAYQVRIKFMGASRRLEKIPAAPLTSEADLIAASERFPLPLLSAKVSDANRAVAEAMVFMAALADDGQKEQLATWETSRLIGKAFKDPDKVDEVFDQAKAEIKALIKQGKTVRTI